MGEMENQLEELAATAGFLWTMARAGRVDQFSCRPNGHYFAFVEHLWHLRDLEIEGYADRIRRILEEDLPLLTDFDGDTIAKERNYIALEWQQPLIEFSAARMRNIDTLRGLRRDVWQRSAIFESSSPIALNDLIGMMRTHDASHVREILELGGGCPIWPLKVAS